MRLPRLTKMPDNGFLLLGIAAPAAAGTNQATGTQLKAQVNLVTGANGTTAVVLPSGVKGMCITVLNTVSTPGSGLPVFPFAGDSAAINGAAADAAFTLDPGQVVTFYCQNKTTWTAAVITAGFVNLGAGTATQAPLVFQSGTNLTTAAAGAVEFDGNAFYATAVASSRQQVDAEQFTIASADSATYNNTGLDTASAAPVFTATMGAAANGAVTLQAGKQYSFEAVYYLTNTGTTAHTWATLFAGTATFTDIAMSVFGISGTAANTPQTGGLSGFAKVATAVVATASSTSATEQVMIMLTGTLTVNAGGTLIPQLQASARPGASGTPGVVVKRGSFFRIWEMASAAQVGNWS